MLLRPPSSPRPRPVGALAVLLALAACGGGQPDMPREAQSAAQTEPLRQALRVSVDKAPLVTQGQGYRMLLQAQGGEGALRWRVVEGALPAGLVLDAAGVVHGQARQPGTQEVGFEVLDARGQLARGTLRFDVVEAQAARAVQDGSLSQQRGRTDEGGASVRTRSASSSSAPMAPLPGLISQLQAMPEGSWAKVNLNLFSQVWTPSAQRVIEAAFGGPGSPKSLIGAWGGFTWDTRRGDLLIYGGGHANYGGNDVYRWRGSSQLWERASLPSEIAKDARNNFRAVDGPTHAPPAAHTYDNNLYLPVIDRMLVVGGAAYNNGGAFLTDNFAGGSRVTGPYLFDPSKTDPMKVGGTTGSHVQRVAPYPEVTGGQMWQNRELHQSLSGTPSLPTSHVEGCTGYAEENGLDVAYLLAATGSGTARNLFRYVIQDVQQPGTDSWVRVGSGGDMTSGQMACGYDAARKLFVRTGSSTRHFFMWNLATPSSVSGANAAQVVSYTESAGTLAAALAAGTFQMKYCGLDFDDARGKFVLWCGANRIWELTPPSSASASGWTLEAGAATGGAVPSTNLGTGILGKWKFIPNLNAFIGLQNSDEGQIWLYKPVGWQAPGSGAPVNQPPSVSLSAPSPNSVVQPASTITVSAQASDADGSVAQVQFRENGLVVATLDQAPWTMQRTAPASGSLVYTATAIDNLGASRTSSAVTVQVQAANQAPSVSLSQPSAGQVFLAGAPITLTALPSDPENQIARVEFFANDLALGVIDTAPWSLQWLNAPAGAHTLRARVTDMGGLSADSASVPVSVQAQGSGGTVVLQQGLQGYAGARDAPLYSFYPTRAYGSRVSLTDQSSSWVPLLRFAIFAREGGPVPDNALIVSAQLSLFKSNSYDATFSATRLLCDWDESTATWQLCRTGRPWASVGGQGSDLAASADGTAYAAWGAGWLTLNVTPGLQAMQSGAQNFGWRVRRIAGDNVNAKNFHSREFATDPTLRPKLTVTYTVP